MLYLFLPILAFYRIQARPIFKKSWVAVLVFGLIMMEYWPKTYPFINKVETADFVNFVSDDVEVIWQIPTGIADGFEARGEFDVQRLQDQIEHKKSILGGYISRVPQSTFERFDGEMIFKITNDVALGRKMMHDLREVDVRSFLLRYQPDLIIIEKGNSELKQLIYTLFGDHIDHNKTDQSSLKEHHLIYLDLRKVESISDL